MDDAPVRLEDLITYVNDQHPAGGTLGRMSYAVEVSRDLGELTDRLIGHYVDQARSDGASWSAISQSMGVSEQAAQQCFAETTTDIFGWELNDWELGDGFDRFTDRATRVVLAAQETAGIRGHTSAGTEHILLGLLGESEGVAARALESLGISLEAVRRRVDEIIGKDQQASPGHMPFSPRAKLALELSSTSRSSRCGGYTTHAGGWTTMTIDGR